MQSLGLSARRGSDTVECKPQPRTKPEKSIWENEINEKTSKINDYKVRIELK